MSFLSSWTSGFLSTAVSWFVMVAKCSSVFFWASLMPGFELGPFRFGGQTLAHRAKGGGSWRLCWGVASAVLLRKGVCAMEEPDGGFLRVNSRWYDCCKTP